MDPDPLLIELQAINAQLVTLNATTTAAKEAQATWHTQSLFLLESCAICLGILWGLQTWLVICESKRWRNPFW